MANFCRDCGTELVKGSLFCGGCGRSLKEVKPSCPTCGQQLPDSATSPVATGQMPVGVPNNAATPQQNFGEVAGSIESNPTGLETSLSGLNASHIKPVIYGVDFRAGSDCGNCGTTLEDNATECSICGTRDFSQMT